MQLQAVPVILGLVADDQRPITRTSTPIRWIRPALVEPSGTALVQRDPGMVDVVDLTARRPGRGGPPSGPGGHDERLGGIRPLGFEHDRYYYLSPVTDQIVTLRPGEHANNPLLMLQPLEWWVEEFPTQKHQRSAFDVSGAAGALMSACQAVGPFDETRIRGRGVWWDDGRAVVHLGTQVWSDGRMWRPVEAPFNGIYEAGRSWGNVLGEPLGPGQAELLLDICTSLRFKRPLDGEVIACWLVVALVPGALNWRPHLWITAEAGAGKSWVHEHIMAPVLGEVALRVQGETTEAGIRQQLRHDSRPVLFDEAEPGQGPSEEARTRKVLQFARQASSANAAPTVKGGADHRAQAFNGAFCLCMSSVMLGLARQADEDRFTVLEMLVAPAATQAERDQAAEHFQTLQAMALRLTPQFARGLFGLVVHELGTLRHNAEQLATAIARRVGSRRTGDQLGTILAGALLLRSTERLTADQAAVYVAGLPLEVPTPSSRPSDQEQCLQSILSKPVSVDSQGGKRKVTRTLGQLAEIALRRSTGDDEELSLREAEQALRRHGLTTIPQGENEPAGSGTLGRDLVVAARHDELRELLRTSDFAGGHWHKLLQRLPGARETTGGVWFGQGAKVRGVIIPAALIVKQGEFTADAPGQGT